MSLSVLAQLVAYKFEEGVLSTTQLASEIGVTERSIRRAKAELTRTQESAQADSGVRPPDPSPPLKERSPPAPPLKKIHPTPSATTFSESRAAREKARCADKEVSEKEPQNSWNPRTGKLTLGLAERAYWVPKLGGDEALDLALMQAANFLQANSGRPLLVQVRAQLSRTLALKKQSDERYRLRVVEGGKAESSHASIIESMLAERRQAVAS